MHRTGKPTVIAANFEEEQPGHPHRKWLTEMRRHKRVDNRRLDQDWSERTQETQHQLPRHRA